jgi:DNA-binding Xre family transcriptional regulator
MRQNDIDIGLEIRTLLKQQGIKTKWLAEQIGCDNSNLGKMLNNKHIYPELLLKISIALKTNLFEQYNQSFLASIKKPSK